MSLLTQQSDRNVIERLKESFKTEADRHEKQLIASNLVRLGEKDDSYWTFLMKNAQNAIDREIPFPFELDPGGQIKQTTSGPKGRPRGKYSDAFINHCKNYGLAPDTVAKEAVYDLPQDILFLGMTGDARAGDTLLKALGSQNYFVVLAAAKGLARIQDRRAIKPLIMIALHAPAEFAQLIARSLLFFDDADAQFVAENTVQNSELVSAIRKLAKEKGPEAVFLVP